MKNSSKVKAKNMKVEQEKRYSSDSTISNNKLKDEELLKLSMRELVDMGVCPTCLDRRTNHGFFGDDSRQKTYEDEDIECLFVGNPRADGHMMISTKTHYHDLSEAPDYLNEKIIRFVKAYMKILKDVYSAEKVYLCAMSDGHMNHYHVQLIPRYSYEERGSKNFVKPRKEYVFSKEKFEKVRRLINEIAKDIK